MDKRSPTIEQALAIIGEQFRREGLPHFHDPLMAVVDAALRLLRCEVEVLLVYVLDAQSRLLCVEEVARGSGSSLVFSIRRLARIALEHGGASVIVIHNHPGDDCRPSPDDEKAAEKIDLALVGFGILARHFVVSETGFADINTGKVHPFPEVAATLEIREKARCPHCHGPLDTPQ